MNAIQLIVLLFGNIALLAVISKFRKRYNMLSRATIKVAMFSPESVRKTKNIFKILSGWLLPSCYRNISSKTKEEEVKKMLILREVVLHGLYCLTVIGLTIGAYIAFSSLE